jgi:ribosomal protein L24E
MVAEMTSRAFPVRERPIASASKGILEPATCRTGDLQITSSIDTSSWLHVPKPALHLRGISRGCRKPISRGGTPRHLRWSSTGVAQAQIPCWRKPTRSTGLALVKSDGMMVWQERRHASTAPQSAIMHHSLGGSEGQGRTQG